MTIKLGHSPLKAPSAVNGQHSPRTERDEPRVEALPIAMMRKYVVQLRVASHLESEGDMDDLHDTPRQ